MASTGDRLIEYSQFQTRNPFSLSSQGFAVSPHLIAHDLTTSSFHVILSNNGKAIRNLIVGIGILSHPGQDILDAVDKRAS